MLSKHFPGTHNTAGCWEVAKESPAMLLMGCMFAFLTPFHFTSKAGEDQGTALQQINRALERLEKKNLCLK